MRDGIGTDEADVLVIVAVVFYHSRCLVRRGRDAVGAGLFLGSAGSCSNILRSGLSGQSVLSGAAAIASTTSSPSAASATILAAGTVSSALVTIASTARRLASAAASR